ncbi:MAG: 2-C-methyl-D-erythritol 4-phosphate cytidylyltransferase, partial [Clostridia bacterium]|nr:2-C-methyl-D-erythritol 4-phosphate cytidylyltransferase [Clostridia bacterium]
MNDRVHISAILLAAGSSQRMGADPEGVPINKMLLRFSGKTAIEYCLERFSALCDEVIFVVSESTFDLASALSERCAVPVKVVFGGERRQDSVINGVRAASGDIVAIHDCARMLVSSEAISRAIKSAEQYGSGVAAIPVRDTIRFASTGETVPRDDLYQMQTPQCFDRLRLIDAYAVASGDHTDDASVWQQAYGPVKL